MARELPVVKVRFPVGLLKQKNGQLDPKVLRAIRPSGKLYRTTAIAYDAMKRAAKAENIFLKPTSTFDSYRPYTVQEAVFRQRYQLEPLKGRPVRRWEGRLWYLKPGLAPVAAPGTSNHGWGLAVDIWNVSQNGRLEWLLVNAARFGFSWELQSEPWHLRYVLGDDLPDGVTP